MNPDKLPKTTSGIQKLAQKEFKKKRIVGDASYKEGDPLEKVWDNYQLPKQLKRDFKATCKKHGIIASEYLRACVKILVNKKAEVDRAKKALNDVKKVDTDKLKD